MPSNMMKVSNFGLKFNRDLGGDLENSKSSASHGEQYIELNDPTFAGLMIAVGLQEKSN